MTPTVPTPQDVQISTRVSKGLLAGLVRIQARVLKETGFKPTVSEVARKLLQDGVEHDKKNGKKK
jgi:hypothetical protein